jgi:hypothetical protein
MNKLELALAFTLGVLVALAATSIWSPGDGPGFGVEPLTDSDGSQVVAKGTESLRLPPKSSRETVPAVQVEGEPVAAVVETIPVLGGASFALKDGELFMDGAPFSEFDVEAMGLTDLKRIKSGLGVVFRSVKKDFVAANSVESMFLSIEVYNANHMWHDDIVAWSGERQSIDSDGEPFKELGYLNVTRGMCADGFTLKDAVRRVHQAPAFATSLHERGESYKLEHSLRVPNATWEVTEDQTTWVAKSPSGSIVGSFSTPTVQNM